MSKADEERARELLHTLLQYPDFYAEELVEKDLQLVLAAFAAVREEQQAEIVRLREAIKQYHQPCYSGQHDQCGLCAAIRTGP